MPPEQAERLARYRAGAMDAAERTAFEREVLESAALAEALRREGAHDAITRGTRRPARVLDANPALEVAREFREDRGSLIHAMIPVVAAIVIGFAVWWWTPNSPGPAPDRDVVRGQAAVSRALEPVGELPGPPARLVWTRDPSARRYRVELYSVDGKPLGVHVTPDTSLALDAVIRATPAEASWRVVPLDAEGRERPATALAAYRVTGR
jgi:hypothetical protein